MKTWIRHAAALAAFVATVAAHAAGIVGNTLPPGFPSIEDTSLARPLIGFGAAGAVTRTPVILIHGNNDTPFATACSPYGRIQALAQFLADNGYSTSELWGVGYQGDQCDLASDQTRRSSIAHTNAANVPDLRRFVRAVMDFTGAKRVDIVGHSLGVTLAREWMRQDEAQHLVRRFVAIDGPNHGIINCSPDPANYFQAPAAGGFTPTSDVCRELGSPDTFFSCACSTAATAAARTTGPPACWSSATATPASSTFRCRTARWRRCPPWTLSASPPTFPEAPACVVRASSCSPGKAPTTRSCAPATSHPELAADLAGHARFPYRPAQGQGQGPRRLNRARRIVPLCWAA